MMNNMKDDTFICPVCKEECDVDDGVISRVSILITICPDCREDGN